MLIITVKFNTMDWIYLGGDSIEYSHVQFKMDDTRLVSSSPTLGAYQTTMSFSDSFPPMMSWRTPCWWMRAMRFIRKDRVRQNNGSFSSLDKTTLGHVLHGLGTYHTPTNRNTMKYAQRLEIMLHRELNRILRVTNRANLARTALKDYYTFP